MWYEILPSGFIIYGAMLLTHWGTYFGHKLVLGTPYRKELNIPINRLFYLRNRRLTNNPYKFKGLEEIEDLE